MASTATDIRHSTAGSLKVAGQSRRKQANSAVPAPETLAGLLAEVGLAVEEFPAARLTSSAAPLAAIATELVERAQNAGVTLPAAEPTASAAASLRQLGVLAARTAGTRIEVGGDSVAYVRRLLAA